MNPVATYPQKSEPSSVDWAGLSGLSRFVGPYPPLDMGNIKKKK
jgi:hypothetical protein